ncbi:oryzain alpha chain-like [Triticum dicoccoides]|uniref:oryzain alpha chain-like n=1 Tax=Triticum dicoccoides TaxID=85692 RepID=UPI0018918D82|nr:oryzain alpha chain-like [Triticum dicoccoides]
MRSSTALMAAVSLLLLLVSLAAAADIQIRDKSEEETRRIFVEWKAKYGRSYDSIREEERRYAIFKDNLLRSIDQQSPAGIRWQLNNSSDHTHGEELRAFRPCYIPLDVYGDWSKTKGAWIAYMLFVCSFIVVLAFCKLHA